MDGSFGDRKTESSMKVPRATTTNLPSVAELPLPAAYSYSSFDEMARMALIPTDDARLRAHIIEQFQVSNRWNNMAGGNPELAALIERSKKLNLETSNIPACTPGGVAWKLSEALDIIQDEKDDEWCYWRYLIASAAVDCINLERARSSLGDETKPAAMIPTDPLTALCHEADELSADVARAFDAVTNGLSQESEAAQKRAEKIHARYNALFGRIVGMKPRTLQGWIAQLGIVRRELFDIKGLSASELENLDMFEKAAHVVMGHAELFAEGTARDRTVKP
jgi:hypothetical protein